MTRRRSQLIPPPWLLAALVLCVIALALFAASLLLVAIWDRPYAWLSWVAYPLLVAGWTCGEVYRKQLRQQQ